MCNGDGNEAQGRQKQVERATAAMSTTAATGGIDTCRLWRSQQKSAKATAVKSKSDCTYKNERWTKVCGLQRWRWQYGAALSAIIKKGQSCRFGKDLKRHANFEESAKSIRNEAFTVRIRTHVYCFLICPHVNTVLLTRKRRRFGRWTQKSVHGRRIRCIAFFPLEIWNVDINLKWSIACNDKLDCMSGINISVLLASHFLYTSLAHHSESSSKIVSCPIKVTIGMMWQTRFSRSMQMQASNIIGIAMDFPVWTSAQTSSSFGVSKDKKHAIGHCSCCRDVIFTDVRVYWNNNTL